MISRNPMDIDIGSPGGANEVVGVAGILGDSSAMRRLRELVLKVARSTARAVLVTGESGTGKGLVARAIHAASDRSDLPFVTITCSAIPDHLLESELFGHEAGAFTDGRKRKEGLLESAEGGSVFLDEIGDMAPPLQAKLLGVLEERRFRRVGGVKEIPIDVRVISATHRDLPQMVLEQAFREDLLHRLSVVPIRVPALREHTEDIPELATRFLREIGRDQGRTMTLAPSALKLLQSRDWSGNVRELRNALERAVVFGAETQLGAGDFEWSAGELRSSTHLPAKGLDVELLIDDLVREAMARTDGNQSAAARLLRMTRNQIRYRLEKMGDLAPPRARRSSGLAAPVLPCPRHRGPLQDDAIRGRGGRGVDLPERRAALGADMGRGAVS